MISIWSFPGFGDLEPTPRRSRTRVKFQDYDVGPSNWCPTSTGNGYSRGKGDTEQEISDKSTEKVYVVNNFTRDVWLILLTCRKSKVDPLHTVYVTLFITPF